MNILSLATGMVVARNAGIADPGEQVRLGLVGAVAGGVVGVALTNQMARNEVGSAPPVAVVAGSNTVQEPLPLPSPPAPAPGNGTPAGPVLVEVPRVHHLPVDEATRRLTRPELGLKVATQYARPAEDEARDTVLEQHNQDGSRTNIVVYGATIVLTLSSGPLETVAGEPSTGELSKQVGNLGHQMEGEFRESIVQLHSVIERIGVVETTQQELRDTQKQMLDILQKLAPAGTGTTQPTQTDQPTQKNDVKAGTPGKT